MTLTYNRFFEGYENYHSFVDLVNLAKEIADYIYNRDIIHSQFFDSFIETNKGFDIQFNKSGQKNFFIDIKKKKVFDESGDEQIIDVVYEQIEKLYNIIRNDEVLINIRQMDEVKTFNQIFNKKINESFEDDLKDKLSEQYISLKRGILELLDKTLNSDVTKLQGFIENYIKPDSTEILDGFVDDAEIFDMYLKYQPDIDQILKDNDYYEDIPDVNSLYDYVIDGTIDAVVYCMEDIKKELFE